MALFKRFRFLAIALISLAIAIALTNCDRTPPGDSTTRESPAAAFSALVFGSAGPPVNLEPGNITDGNSIIVQEQIYNRLIDFKPGTTELEPSLATDWSASDDGLTWTLNLRSDVQFHDGTEFNADAVAFNVNRWWDPAFEYGYRDSGKTYEIWAYLFGGFKGTEESVLQEIRVVDPDTVEFVLLQPFAAFPAAIASGYFGIASPTAIQSAGASYGTPSSTAVGTGPFVFEEWRSGDRITLSANLNYWKADLPKAEQLVITFVEDPAARLAQLRAGTLDFTVELTPDQQAELQSDSNLESVLRPSFNVGFLALNPGYEPLATPEVRRAIAQAINKTEIIEAFWQGLGETDAHFTPPSMADYQSDSVTDYEYDPDAAKQALADAGYPDGFSLDLWYMPVSRPYFPNPKPIAEAFAAELSAIGITVNLQTKDWSAYLEDRNTPPGFQSFMLGWTGDYGDPDNFYYAHFGPGATADLGNWSNPRVVELLNQARAESNEAARQEDYAEVDEILFEEAVRIPIVHSQPLLAQRSNIDGWVPSPFGSEPFETVEKS